MRRFLGLALFVAATAASGKPLPPPVIDMHLHAYPVGDAAGAAACPGSCRSYYAPIDPRAPFQPGRLSACANPFHAPTSDDALMRDSIAMLRKYNVRHAVTSGLLPDVAKWQAAAPERIIPAIAFADTDLSTLPVDEYRRLHRAGAFAVFAEVENEYLGVAPNDPRWEPYFAMAEELDIPVGIHMGEGPVNGARFPGYEAYRVRFTSPLLLEDVLIRHPKLRIYAMHYGSPMVEQTIAMLFTYPNLYVDVACNDWLNAARAILRPAEADGRRRFRETDHVRIGPDVVARGDRTGDPLDRASALLSPTQKRDILYNNAARFLRLSPAQIRADNRR